jgi:hypothetical protein
MHANTFASRWIRPMLAGVAMAVAATALAAASPEVFMATASLKTAAGATVSAPIEIAVDRWTSDAERDRAVEAVKSGGNAALKTLLAGAPAAGTLRIGERTATLRFARARSSGGGRVITVIAAEPVLHLGAGLPAPKPQAGYDFAVALFEVDAAGKGSGGELAPAAKLTVRSDDSFMVEDYGAEAIRLNTIGRK